jgi:uncharacterized protein DUF6885
MIVEQAARAGQQKDSLCGPFHAARVLLDAGVGEREGLPVDQDLVALHAGTTVPPGPEVPPGAESLRDYRYELPVVDAERAGTTPAGLADAIAQLSGGRLECVPLRGDWRAEAVERLVDAAPALGARLIANLRTGRLWGSHPPVEALVAELFGEQSAAVPSADWDVGHFVELVTVARGRGGALVVVRDSYPSFGWMGHHLQPPSAIAAALLRGDGRAGGVLAVVRSGGAAAVVDMADELELDARLWEN